MQLCPVLNPHAEDARRNEKMNESNCKYFFLKRVVFSVKVQGIAPASFCLRKRGNTRKSDECPYMTEPVNDIGINQLSINARDFHK
jgi:hypothetical protein